MKPTQHRSSRSHAQAGAARNVGYGPLSAIFPGSTGRRALGLALAAAAGVGTAEAAHPVPGAPGVQVIPPDEVLKRYTVEAPDGALLFTDAGGVTWQLVTDPHDPQISNPGLGGFYPADVDGVLATLDALPDEFLWTCDALVFVLPYPRSGAISSSASDGAIYLTPGVQPLEDGPTLRALVAHEFGHVVQRRLLPDSDTAGWETYRALRGIADPDKYSATSPHAYRPREIFAEDFRVICGDPVAAGDGSVENPELDTPTNDPDLVDFFFSLPAGVLGTADVAEAEADRDWRVFPNPVPRGGVLHLERAGGGPPEGVGTSPEHVDLFDASGRRVGALRLVPDGAGRWSASLGQDRDLRAGAYWARVRDARDGARPVAIHVLP